MLRKLINTVFILLLAHSVSVSQPGMPEARNVIYLSAGIGLIAPFASAGIFYERMVSPNASIKMGINYTYSYSPNPDYSDDAYISIPLTINYLTSNNNKFDIGLGGGPIFHIKGNYKDAIRFIPSLNIGYRYQPESKSMVFKIGIDFPAAPSFNIIGAGYHF